MKCPVCDQPLSISSREGVEIDFCPQCRGVWLDRGELDKILDRVNATMVAAPAAAPAPPAPLDDRRRDDDRYRTDDRYRSDDRYDDRRRFDDRYRYDKKKSNKKKAKSFLEDIFDL